MRHCERGVGEGEGGGEGALKYEAGRLLTLIINRVGAYSRLDAHSNKHGKLSDCACFPNSYRKIA